MFWKKKPKSTGPTLQEEIAAHKDAIYMSEDFDDAFPDPAEHPEMHKQPVSLEAMDCRNIQPADRQLFEKTVSVGNLLNYALSRGSWRVIESDTRLMDDWSGYRSYRATGRHYKLFYGKLRTGALVISTDAEGDEDSHGVHLSLTFRFPFLYEFDAIYDMLRTLIWQMSDGTAEDMQRRDSSLTMKLLRTLWGIQRDEMYVFYFDETGPATVMFEALAQQQKRDRRTDNAI
ncbi:hypothetical protein AB4Z52_13580 [Rhizobium sp. 2YAF20]|uniref:hypothetical protein n=1 Tax=Rhizobium sp. 2YAF20 TaxID=3233027 RepID=UPI003F9AB931